MRGTSIKVALAVSVAALANSAGAAPLSVIEPVLSPIARISATSAGASTTS